MKTAHCATWSAEQFDVVPTTLYLGGGTPSHLRIGELARIVDDGYIENVYRVQIMNATEAEQRYSIFMDHLSHVQMQVQPEIIVGPAEARWVAVAVRIPPEVAQTLGPGAQRTEMVVTRQRQPH